MATIINSRDLNLEATTPRITTTGGYNAILASTSLPAGQLAGIIPNIGVSGGPSGWQNSNIILGARNRYTNTTPIIDQATGSVLVSRSYTGFTIYGNNTNTGIMRINNVITRNGPYTISFDLVIGTVGSFPLTFDFCNNIGITIYPTTILQHFEFTDTITNYSSGTYNFIDINQLSAQNYIFTNFKIEEGNKSTAWTPSPEDVNAATTAAQSTASTAATDATLALTQLTNIASDNILSPVEKPMAVQDYAVITGEQTGISAQATAYGIITEKTNYIDAVTALTSYLGGLAGWNTIPGSDVNIVGSTWRTNWSGVYTARQVLLNKIAELSRNTAITVNANGTLSGAGGGQVSSLPILDTRAVNTPPSGYGIVHLKEFKTCTVIGLTTSAAYCILETLQPWSDASGGNATQWAYVSSGEVWKRSAPCGAASWGAWVRDLDTSVYTGALNATANQSDAITNAAINTASTTSTWIGVTGTGKPDNNANAGGIGGYTNTDPFLTHPNEWTSLSNYAGTFGAGEGIQTAWDRPAGGSNDILSAPFPISPSKTYLVETAIYKWTGTTATHYFLVAFYDVAEALLTGTLYPTGWGSAGTYHYYGLTGASPAVDGVNRYSQSFGAGATPKIPATAVTARVGILGGYAGTGRWSWGGARISEVKDWSTGITGSGKPADNATANQSDAITNAAITAAQTAANNAQISANTANTALSNIASDGYLTSGEKSAVVKDYAVITSEQVGIDTQAGAYGITIEKAPYDNAVVALTSYLSTLSGWNVIPGVDVAIVGSTFRSKFSDVYTTRQTLLNAIYAQAKALANAAATTANWSGVTNIPSAAGSNILTVYGIDRYLPVSGKNDYYADPTATNGYAARIWLGWSAYNINGNPISGAGLLKGWVIGKTYRVLARMKKVGAPADAELGFYNSTTAAVAWNVNPIASLTTSWQTLDLGTMTPNWAATDQVYMWHGTASTGGTSTNCFEIDWIYFQPVNTAEGATVNQSDAITNAAIATKLTNAATNVMATNFFLQTNGYAGGNGIALYDGGLIAKNAGVTKFAIDSAGNATFAGDISGSTIGASGGLSLNGATWANNNIGFYTGLETGSAVMRVGNPLGSNIKFNGSNVSFAVRDFDITYIGIITNKPPLYVFAFGGVGTWTAGIGFTSSGLIEARDTNVISPFGLWYGPQTTNIGGAPGAPAYWIRASQTAGTPVSGSLLNTWLGLDATRAWTVSSTALSSSGSIRNTADLTIIISNSATGSPIISTMSATLTSEATGLA